MILFLKSTITKLNPRQGLLQAREDCGKQLRRPATWRAWLVAGKLLQWCSQSYTCRTDSSPSWSKLRYYYPYMDRRCSLHISSSLCHQKKYKTPIYVDQLQRNACWGTPRDNNLVDFSCSFLWLGVLKNNLQDSISLKSNFLFFLLF